MIIRTENMMIPIAVVSIDRTQDITPFNRFMNGSGSELEWENIVRPMITAIANTATSVAWSSPKTFRAGGIKVIIDHPVTPNTLFSAVATPTTGVCVVKDTVPVLYNNLKQVKNSNGTVMTPSVDRLVKGAVLQTPMAGLIGSLVQRELVRRMSVNTAFTSVQRNNYLGAYNKIQEDINRLYANNHAVYEMPEECIVVDGPQVYFHKPCETAFNGDITPVVFSSMDAELVTVIRASKDAGTEWYKYATGATGTISELQSQLQASGVSLWLSEELPFYRMPTTASTVITLGQDEVQLVRENMINLSCLIPLYAKWFFSGVVADAVDMTGIYASMIKSIRKFGNTFAQEVDAMSDTWYHMMWSYLQREHPTATDAMILQSLAYVEFAIKRIGFEIVARGTPTSPSDFRLVRLVTNLRHVHPSSWPTELRSVTTISDTSIRIALSNSEIVLQPTGATPLKAHLMTYLRANDVTKAVGDSALLLLQTLERLFYTVIGGSDNLIINSDGTVSAKVSIPNMIGSAYPFILRRDASVIIPISSS